jgi:ankyrin repeat protein
MRAAKALDVAAMRVLLDAGADVRHANRTNATALMFAAGLGRNRSTDETDHAAVDAVQLCLDHGADVDAANAAGQTAVHIAVGQSDAVLQLLAERGARIDLKYKQGKTPLDLLDEPAVGRGAPKRDAAAREKTATLMRHLIAQGASDRRELPAR